MLPLYWAAVTSLKGKGEIYRVPPTLIPYMSTLENYKKIFTLENGVYLTYFMNSIWITICSILCTSIVSVAAGYGLSKLDLKGGKIMLACILGNHDSVSDIAYSVVYDHGKSGAIEYKIKPGTDLYDLPYPVLHLYDEKCF